MVMACQQWYFFQLIYLKQGVTNLHLYTQFGNCKNSHELCQFSVILASVVSNSTYSKKSGLPPTVKKKEKESYEKILYLNLHYLVPSSVPARCH
jgi:hypothetical protein